MSLVEVIASYFMITLLWNILYEFLLSICFFSSIIVTIHLGKVFFNASVAIGSILGWGYEARS